LSIHLAKAAFLFSHEMEDSETWRSTPT